MMVLNKSLVEPDKDCHTQATSVTWFPFMGVAQKKAMDHAMKADAVV